MNTQKGSLKDVRLRRALQLAFDYEGMVQVYKGYAEVPNSPLPKGFTAAYDPSLPVFRRDMAQAKRLMAEAGFQAKGPTLSFVYTETEPQARLAGLLLQQSVQDLGITVNLEGKPFATLAAQIANLETAPDIQATLTMTPRSADPGELLRTLYLGTNAGKSFNYSWYASPWWTSSWPRPIGRSTRPSAWRSTATSPGSSSTTRPRSGPPTHGSSR
jgi:ABC-type transport system substrate-binding protein